VEQGAKQKVKVLPQGLKARSFIGGFKIKKNYNWWKM
jgi:hypothetical protein